MRIYKDRFYVLALTPGISGFKKWGIVERQIVTGHKAARERHLVECEYQPSGNEVAELHDGHLAGYRPSLPIAGALDWLKSNPFAAISVA